MISSCLRGLQEATLHLLWQVVSSMSTTRAFAAEREESRRYANGMRKYLGCCVRQAKLYFFYSSATFTFLPYCTYCLVLFYGAQLINTPEGCMAVRSVCWRSPPSCLCHPTPHPYPHPYPRPSSVPPLPPPLPSSPSPPRPRACRPSLFLSLCLLLPLALYSPARMRVADPLRRVMWSFGVAYVKIIL